MKTDDVTVRITAIDEVTPALRRIRRRLWWYQHGDTVVALFVAILMLLAALLICVAYLLGRATA